MGALNKIIPGEACDGAKQQLCKDIWWYYFSNACNLFKPGLLPDELLGDAVQERIFFWRRRWNRMQAAGPRS